MDEFKELRKESTKLTVEVKRIARVRGSVDQELKDVKSRYGALMANRPQRLAQAEDFAALTQQLEELPVTLAGLKDYAESIAFDLNQVKCQMNIITKERKQEQEREDFKAFYDEQWPKLKDWNRLKGASDLDSCDFDRLRKQFEAEQLAGGW